MHKLKFLFLLLGFLITLSITEDASAQVRRRAVHRARVERRVHRRVVARRAHIRYAHMPRWGTVVTVLPSNTIVVKRGAVVYHYREGVYYAQRNAGFVVVRPLVGLRIHVLPAGYRTVVVGPRNYFYYYGAFYTKASGSDEYEVVESPVGAVVDALPDGYEVKKVGDTEYYVLDDTYYAEVDTDEFEDGVGYEVVKL